MYRELDKLQPVFREKVDAFLKECDWIFITESWRSQERQDDLYAQGRTKPGEIVTWTTTSNHTQGLAIDIAFNGEVLYPSDFEQWRMVANIAKKYGIDWGYDLWGTDKPHFQDNGEEEDPFEKYVNWAKSIDLMNDYSNLNNPVKRNELIKILNNFEKHLINLYNLNNNQ